MASWGSGVFPTGRHLLELEQIGKTCWKRTKTTTKLEVSEVMGVPQKIINFTDFPQAIQLLRSPVWKPWHLQRWQLSQRLQAPARLTRATPQQQAEAIEVFFTSVGKICGKPMGKKMINHDKSDKLTQDFGEPTFKAKYAAKKMME